MPEPKVTRSPIVVVVGHVDHGKTSLLDKIRQGSVAAREAGGITQHVGATEVPIAYIEKSCGKLLKAFGLKFTVPGLLFIDTPGHEAFTNLRQRGGSVADIAILVIDVNQGVQPQTKESIQILKTYKVPFLVAANKIDMVAGWRPVADATFSETIQQQNVPTQEQLDKKVYELVGQLYEQGFEAERFDRISDFTKQVVIVPVSARTGEGVPELLSFIVGLSQRFLGTKIATEAKGPGRGSILEVKEERGLGPTVDVVLYNGTLKKGDSIVFGTLDGAKVAKVKALLKPKPLEEIRDPRERFDYVDSVTAASGVKIAAPGIEAAIAGSPLLVTVGDEAELKAAIEKELKTVLIETESTGIILKADALGSLEAITKMLGDKGIPVRRASIGHVIHRDIIEADAVRKQDRYLGLLMAFNVQVPDELRQEAKKIGLTVIDDKVIYSLLDRYTTWRKEEAER